MPNGIAIILRTLELDTYMNRFVEAGVTVDVLPELTDDDLKDLGIEKLGERKRLLMAFRDEQSSLPADSSSKTSIAATFLESGNLTEALKLYEQILAEDPVNYEAWLGKAQAVVSTIPADKTIIGERIRQPVTNRITPVSSAYKVAVDVATKRFQTDPDHAGAGQSIGDIKLRASEGLADYLESVVDQAKKMHVAILVGGPLIPTKGNKIKRGINHELGNVLGKSVDRRRADAVEGWQLVVAWSGDNEKMLRRVYKNIAIQETHSTVLQFGMPVQLTSGVLELAAEIAQSVGGDLVEAQAELEAFLTKNPWKERWENFKKWNDKYSLWANWRKITGWEMALAWVRKMATKQKSKGLTTGQNQRKLRVDGDSDSDSDS